jgi:hypothetical protein
VARTIICSSCGARDTIHFAPRHKKVLCRRCAADLLGVDDPDTDVRSPKPFVCAACGRAGMTQARIRPGKEFVCSDCLHGIESQQDRKTKAATRLSSRVLRVRKRSKED